MTRRHPEGGVRRTADVELGSALRGRDLVVFSNDWDGDPLSKTHIMRILARDNRVLWVNSIGNRTPKPNAHDARRIAKKFTAFRRGLREVEHNLFVLSPLAIPFFGSEWVRRLNRMLLRRQIHHAARQLGFQRFISWSYLPASAPVSGTLGEELVVYQCVDEFSAFSDTNGRHIAELERQLLAKADLVITSAQRLWESKRKLNPHTALVRHGVDWRHFARACDPATAVPEEIAGLPRPVIGFFGLIADWVDLDVLEACARAHPEGSVVVLGKVSPGVNVSRLQEIPNVKLLGRKRYEDLPGYCKGFDVAVNPFRINELTLNANPLKVREYLAAGLPVVSSAVPEVEALGLCRIARSTEEFLRCVDECLADRPGPSLERARKILHESWDERVDEIRHHVGAALQRRARPDSLAPSLAVQPHPA
ncbi:MAG TPA: glycosyltransferase [Myxococcaceae bacterium]|nr:glycosyltransferase [Myxococcaceae bacterium]